MPLVIATLSFAPTLSVERAIQTVARETVAGESILDGSSASAKFVGEVTGTTFRLRTYFCGRVPNRVWASGRMSSTLGQTNIDVVLYMHLGWLIAPALFLSFAIGFAVVGVPLAVIGVCTLFVQGMAVTSAWYQVFALRARLARVLGSVEESVQWFPRHKRA